MAEHIYDEVDESAVRGRRSTQRSRRDPRFEGLRGRAESKGCVRTEGARPGTLLTRNARVSEQQARRTVRRAAVLSEAPAMRSALMIGAVSVGHVDAFTDATRRSQSYWAGRWSLGSRRWRAWPLTQSPEEFAHSCHRCPRSSRTRWRTRRVRTTAAFLSAASVRRRSQRNVQALGPVRPELEFGSGGQLITRPSMTRPTSSRHDPEGPEAADHLAALALADVISVAYRDVDKAPQDPSGSMCRPPRGEFTVLADLRTLTDGLHERSIIEVDPVASSCRSRRYGASLAKRTCCRRCSTGMTLPSTSADRSASPPPTNASPRERCTELCDH